MKTALLLGLALFSLNLQAQNIIIDPNGVDMGKYQTDLAECESLAGQVEGQGGKGLVRGAIVGAAIGAARGNSTQAKKDAGVGAVVGGASGRGATAAEQEKVIKNCLSNRGYTILN